MNKTLSIILIIVALAGGAWYLASTRTVPGPTGPAPEENTIAVYFREELVARALKNMIGMPIEGFDAQLLIGALPGLTESDFESVKTFEGRYDFKNGALEFVREQAQPISTAERTVAPEGYATLLRNVSARLGANDGTREAIDALIDRIDTAERTTIRARLNEAKSALGVTITPLEVEEDSRCPADVQCIWEGRVRVRAKLESGLGTADQIFELNTPITTETEEIMLIEVSPYPDSKKAIAPADYEFAFFVEKRGAL